MSGINPKLTGRTRHRLGWRGVLVLQVEVEQFTWRGATPASIGTYWRDATVLDLQALGAAVPLERR